MKFIRRLYRRFWDYPRKWASPGFEKHEMRAWYWRGEKYREDA